MQFLLPTSWFRVPKLKKGEPQWLAYIAFIMIWAKHNLRKIPRLLHYTMQNLQCI